MMIPLTKALAAVATVAPQDNTPTLSDRQHKLLATELKASMNEHREAVECLRRITEATRIRGPLGTTAYIISDATMQRAQEIVERAAL